MAEAYLTYVGLLGTLIGIASFFAFDIPQKFNEWRFAVFCAPKFFRVKPSEWSVNKTAHIINNNQYPIFGVQLKIIGPEEIMKNLKVEVKEKHFLDSVSSPKFPIDANAFQIFGEEKGAKNCWIRVIVAQVNARTQVDLALEFAPHKGLGRVGLKITDHSREPIPVLRSGNKVAFQFTVKD